MSHRNLDALERGFLDDPWQSIELLRCQVLRKFGRNLHRGNFFHDFPEYVVDAVGLGAHQVLIVSKQGADGDQSIHSLLVSLFPLTLRSEGDMYDFTHTGPSACAAERTVASSIPRPGKRDRQRCDCADDPFLQSQQAISCGRPSSWKLPSPRLYSQQPYPQRICQPP